MSTGLRPTKDEFNEPIDDHSDDSCIAGGFRFLTIRTGGDLDWYENELEHQHHGSLQCCMKCAARLKADYTDFSNTAPWKTTIYDYRTMPRATHPSVKHHMQTSGPEYISIDFAHCSDKGFAGQFAGSVFHELVFSDVLPAGRSIESKIGKLNELFREWRDLHPNTTAANSISRRLLRQTETTW